MIFFTDFFGIDEKTIEEYGAFNISLINDLPVFIDPFLLFGSTKPEYQTLHQEILKYLTFLKEKAENSAISNDEINAWYCFKEVKQNWLGYSKFGNGGSGLGPKFGRAFSSNISKVFADLGEEQITETSHLEKATLFEIGIGKDNVSDFSCNLIKSYLLQYTENFAIKHLKEEQTKIINVEKVYFDYNLQRWMPKKFKLPYLDDYIILTPKDILTKDENWINNHELIGKFHLICNSIPNSNLRAEINNYFKERLPKKEKNKKNNNEEINKAKYETIWKFPKILDYYIKYKENDRAGAESLSKKNVNEVENYFIVNVQSLVELLKNSNFYETNTSSLDEAYDRAMFLKDVIENKDGYKLFYHNGIPIKKESDLQLIYRLTWYASEFDVNREPNNGRGPADYTVSMGSKDKTVIEFKLASNSQLKRNLERQVEVYKLANNTDDSLKVILFFDKSEQLKTQTILKELGLESNKYVILIDARKDNKQSASKI